jgi:tRNA pseudouridine55 synthase
MENRISGFLLVNKPAGISSFGAVYKVRKLLKDITGEKYKVGHSGTLDPAATGLLILAIGKSTKLIPGLITNNKEYLVTMMLGFKSTTGDSEGEISKISKIQPDIAQVEQAMKQFVGDITQTPPIYSAVKVNGQRAYKLARQGKKPEIEPRIVNIEYITDVKYVYPNISFLCKVSSGTYIRSLVEDIGNKLGTEAYMTSLCRTTIGDYSLGDAIDLDKISTENLQKNLFTLE